MKWKSLWCIHREFSYESIAERILKIGPHLPKLLSNIEVCTFFDTHFITQCSKLFAGTCFLSLRELQWSFGWCQFICAVSQVICTLMLVITVEWCFSACGAVSWRLTAVTWRSMSRPIDLTSGHVSCATETTRRSSHSSITRASTMRRRLQEPTILLAYRLVSSLRIQCTSVYTVYRHQWWTAVCLQLWYVKSFNVRNWRTSTRITLELQGWNIWSK